MDTLGWNGSILMAILCFAAQVGPTKVASNLAEWAKLIGFRNIPRWLAQKSADAVATWIGGVGLGIVFGLVLFWFSNWVAHEDGHEPSLFS